MMAELKLVHGTSRIMKSWLTEETGWACRRAEGAAFGGRHVVDASGTGEGNLEALAAVGLGLFTAVQKTLHLRMPLKETVQRCNRRGGVVSRGRRTVTVMAVIAEWCVNRWWCGNRGGVGTKEVVWEPKKWCGNRRSGVDPQLCGNCGGVGTGEVV